jgi:hypothetical protein
MRSRLRRGWPRRPPLGAILRAPAIRMPTVSADQLFRPQRRARQRRCRPSDPAPGQNANIGELLGGEPYKECHGRTPKPLPSNFVFRQPTHRNRLTVIADNGIACPRPPPCGWRTGEARPPIRLVLFLAFSEGIPIQQGHQFRGGLGRTHPAGNNLFVLQPLAIKRRVVIQVRPQRCAFQRNAGE